MHFFPIDGSSSHGLLVLNIQHPGDDGNTDWPDNTGGRPRPATVVITRDDGGVIGS